MNISVEIGKETRAGTVNVRLYIYDGAKIVRMNIPGAIIKPADWDKRRRKVKFGKRFHLQINVLIDRTISNAESLALKYPNLTAAGLKAMLIRGEQEELSQLQDIVSGWKGMPATVKQYKTFASKVASYGKTLDLAKCSDADLREFMQWMDKNHDHSGNTKWSQQKLLNKAIREANKRFDRNLSTLTDAKLTTSTGKEVLSWGELAVLLMYRPLSPSEADYKTIAIGLALTSCRISDLWKMLGSIKVRDGILCARFKCTKPPHPEVSPIIFKAFADCLEKYGVPKERSEQKVRIGVQTVIRSAGIDKHIELHSLRRSFITNFLSLGVIPEHLLAKLFTGHSLGGSDHAVFHGYDHASLALKQRTLLKLLELVDSEATAGIRLLAE